MRDMTKQSLTETHPKNPCIYEKETPGDLPCTHNALRRAVRRLSYLYDEALECSGLKSTQVALIGTIDQMTDPQTALGPTLQALAEALAIQTSALTHALRPLVRDGLVEVMRDARDKRSKHSALTADGKVRLKQALQAWSAVNHHIEEVLGAESAILLRLLADKVASDDFLLMYRDKHLLDTVTERIV